MARVDMERFCMALEIGNRSCHLDERHRIAGRRAAIGDDAGSKAACHHLERYRLCFTCRHPRIGTTRNDCDTGTLHRRVDLVEDIGKIGLDACRLPRFGKRHLVCMRHLRRHLAFCRYRHMEHVICLLHRCLCMPYIQAL
jgi:hypothetical protein